MEKRLLKRLPDTNIIVRYLIKDDQNLFAKAKTFFDKVKKGVERIVILESVIAECVYVLTKIYKVPKGKVAESLIALLNYRGIVNDDRTELIMALKIFSDTNIDIVDAILCAKAIDNVEFFSFDENLKKIHNKVLETIQTENKV